MDKLVQNARDCGDHVHVTVVSLSWRIAVCSGADLVVVANERGGTAYDIDAPHARPQTMLGFDEFCGLFYRDTDLGGVGDMVADILQESEHNYVVLIDGSSRGFEFARLTGSVANHCLKMRKSAMAKTCRVTKPKGCVWKEVIAIFEKCKTTVEMRESMTNYYNTQLFNKLGT